MMWLDELVTMSENDRSIAAPLAHATEHYRPGVRFVFATRADVRAWLASQFPRYQILGWTGLPFYDNGDGVPRPLQGNDVPGRFLYDLDALNVIDARKQPHMVLVMLTDPEPIE